MNQYEVPALIADTFPETNQDIRYLSAIGNVHQAMSIFSTFMRNKILAHQFGKVFKCLQLAERMHVHGNKDVRNAVENTFIYSFSLTSAFCNKEEWRIVKAHMPANLYAVYINQVLS